MENIILSVVTITYNNIKGLRATLDSVDYNLPIEHIVIDGASTDQTKELLSSYKLDNLVWKSEKDQGIYDAMNKGLNLSKGDYVIFMNAGDSFYSSQTLQLIVDSLKLKKPDILYGDTMYVDDHRNEIGLRSKITTRRLPNNLKWEDFINGMMVCHQSFISKRSLSPKFMLNNLSADIDWEIKCLKNAKRIMKVDFILCSYLIGGISQQSHFKSLTDRFKVLSTHFGILRASIAHFYFVMRAVVHSIKTKI